MSDRVVNCALVAGASRGIGLALTKELLKHHQQAQVHATYRGAIPPDPLRHLAESVDGRLQLHSLDVRDDATIGQLAKVLAEGGHEPDLVIHGAGILHNGSLQPEKALKQIKRDNLRQVFDTNAFGPILLAQALIPLMPRERPCHFAALSAMVGSIGDNRIGGWYAYRSSKAALNQLLKTLAIEAGRQRPQLCVTSIHPGTTDTGLSRPFQARVPAAKLYRPQQSAKRIITVILAGRPEDSGRFVNWDGQPLPW